MVRTKMRRSVGKAGLRVPVRRRRRRRGKVPSPTVPVVVIGMVVV